VSVLRPHGYLDGRQTGAWIHEAIKTVCRRHPDETILKVDEDVILVSSRDRLQPEPRTFLVPLVTINNYTTKTYVNEFWPRLSEHCEGHPWIWH
jgi:hypothetical protein